jgi:hypothetical protein
VGEARRHCGDTWPTGLQEFHLIFEHDVEHVGDEALLALPDRLRTASGRPAQLRQGLTLLVYEALLALADGLAVHLRGPAEPLNHVILWHLIAPTNI